MGDAKKALSGESNPKFDRARMLRHTTEKGEPFPNNPAQQANILLPWPPLDKWIIFLERTAKALPQVLLDNKKRKNKTCTRELQA